GDAATHGRGVVLDGAIVQVHDCRHGRPAGGSDAPAVAGVADVVAGRGIAADGAVVERQYGRMIGISADADAGASVALVAVDGAAVERHRAAADDAATQGARAAPGVAADKAVVQRQRAGAVEDPRRLAGLVAVDGAAVERQRAATVEDAAANAN